MVPPILAILAMLTLWAPSAQAHATGPAPVCRLPTVIGVMARELRINPYYTHIDPWRISETPTADPAIVRCDICLNTILYDTPVFGEVPVARCEPRVFLVRALRKGFLVGLPQ